jgi:two-component system, cell cycle sensor histidine kinase and response regulator CckA
MPSSPDVIAAAPSARATPADVVQWFDALVEHCAAGIGVISMRENRYVRANDLLLDLFGMTREEMREADPFTVAYRITHPDELVTEQKLFGELALGARRAYTIEKRIMRADGSSRWGSISVIAGYAESSEPGSHGPLSWAVLHVVDISDRKALAETLERREMEYRHSQKVDALGRLAAGIAHDFNNLLTVISGHAEVLREHYGASGPASAAAVAEAADSLAAIQAASERAAALTAQLLTHGRRGLAAPRPFVLSALAATLQTLLGRVLGSNVEIESALNATGAIVADEGQIGQVVMNLMLNARDAVTDGGKIRLETRDVAVAAGAPLGSVPGPGQWVALIVSDNGHGMTPEIQARIFEPFFTTRAERPGMQGNGLGLGTVQRIVHDARGSIHVQSEPGHGTVMSVYFPREPLLPAVAPRPGPAPLELPPNTHRILVVEDEPQVRALVATVLSGAHYLVTVARDGAEGLHMLESATVPFDLIVTDLVMPKLGGLTLVNQLRERGRVRRALFMSGYSTHMPAELSPFGHFLAKPFTPARLLAAVALALSAP